MLKKGTILLFLVALALAGCASYKGPAKDVEFLAALERISYANPEELLTISHDPFLLDGEILVGKPALTLLWEGLRESGFTFTGGEVLEVQPSGVLQAELFSPSKEVEYFFENYALPGTALGRIKTDQGHLLLILGPRIKGERKILGWGGPLL